MSVNWPGVAATFTLLARPRTLAPSLVVPDITHLDWAAIKQRGVTGVVFDKDNCLTKPYSDTLVPRLQSSWNDLLHTFGPSNVLIVSNSAGTRKDSLLLQAESVSRNLRVPVLVHASPKPSKKCARSILAYFAPPPPPPKSNWLVRKLLRRRKEPPGSVMWTRRDDDYGQSVVRGGTTVPRILVVGDRLTTDVVLAYRLNTISSPSTSSTSPPTKDLVVSEAGLSSDPHPDFSSSPTLHPDPTPRIEAISVLTTTLHAREGFGTFIMRLFEKLVLRYRLHPPATSASAWQDCLSRPALMAATLPPLTISQRLNPLRLIPRTFFFNKVNPEPLTAAYVWQETFSLVGWTASVIARETETMGRRLKSWSIRNDVVGKIKAGMKESWRQTGRTAEGVAKGTEWVGLKAKNWAFSRSGPSLKEKPGT